jgi:glutathione S-transferase
MSSKYNHSTDENVRTDLARLPELLGEVDRLIEDGVLGGAQPNAADFQIGTSVRLLLTFDQLQPLVEQNPRVAEHALRLLPHVPGRIPAVFPPDWVPTGTEAR